MPRDVNTMFKIAVVYATTITRERETKGGMKYSRDALALQLLQFGRCVNTNVHLHLAFLLGHLNGK